MFAKFGDCNNLAYREIVDYKDDCGVPERIFKAHKRKSENILFIGLLGLGKLFY
jgi:hypothetical protein